MGKCIWFYFLVIIAVLGVHSIRRQGKTGIFHLKRKTFIKKTTEHKKSLVKTKPFTHKTLQKQITGETRNNVPKPQPVKYPPPSNMWKLNTELTDLQQRFGAETVKEYFRSTPTQMITSTPSAFVNSTNSTDHPTASSIMHNSTTAAENKSLSTIIKSPTQRMKNTSESLTKENTAPSSMVESKLLKNKQFVTSGTEVPLTFQNNNNNKQIEHLNRDMGLVESGAVDSNFKSSQTVKTNIESTGVQQYLEVPTLSDSQAAPVLSNTEKLGHFLKVKHDNEKTATESPLKKTNKVERIEYPKPVFTGINPFHSQQQQSEEENNNNLEEMHNKNNLKTIVTNKDNNAKITKQTTKNAPSENDQPFDDSNSLGSNPYSFESTNKKPSSKSSLQDIESKENEQQVQDSREIQMVQKTAELSNSKPANIDENTEAGYDYDARDDDTSEQFMGEESRPTGAPKLSARQVQKQTEPSKTELNHEKVIDFVTKQNNKIAGLIKQNGVGSLEELEPTIPGDSNKYADNTKMGEEPIHQSNANLEAVSLRDKQEISGNPEIQSEPAISKYIKHDSNPYQITSSSGLQSEESISPADVPPIKIKGSRVPVVSEYIKKSEESISPADVPPMKIKGSRVPVISEYIKHGSDPYQIASSSGLKSQESISPADVPPIKLKGIGGKVTSEYIKSNSYPITSSSSLKSQESVSPADVPPIEMKNIGAGGGSINPVLQVNPNEEASFLPAGVNPNAKYSYEMEDNEQINPIQKGNLRGNIHLSEIQDNMAEGNILRDEPSYQQESSNIHQQQYEEGIPSYETNSLQGQLNDELPSIPSYETNSLQGSLNNKLPVNIKPKPFQEPLKFHSTLSKSKPHGPSIAFDQLMPSLVSRGLQKIKPIVSNPAAKSKVKSNDPPKALASVAMTTTANNNIQTNAWQNQQNGLIANPLFNKNSSPDLRHTTYKGSRTSYGHGQGQGFGYGKTSYGRGSGHAWAGDNWYTHGPYIPGPSNNGPNNNVPNQQSGEQPSQQAAPAQVSNPGGEVPAAVQPPAPGGAPAAAATVPQYLKKKPVKALSLSLKIKENSRLPGKKTGKVLGPTFKKVDKIGKGKKFAEQATGSGYGNGYGNKESWGQGGGFAWAGKAPPQGAPNAADFLQKPAGIPELPNAAASTTGSGGYSNSGGTQATGAEQQAPQASPASQTPQASPAAQTPQAPSAAQTPSGGGEAPPAPGFYTPLNSKIDKMRNNDKLKEKFRNVSNKLANKINKNLEPKFKKVKNFFNIEQNGGESIQDEQKNPWMSMRDDKND